jgi:hypothetical protein
MNGFFRTFESAPVVTAAVIVAALSFGGSVAAPALSAQGRGQSPATPGRDQAPPAQGRGQGSGSNPNPAGIPELTGTWDGGGRAHPVNSETVPWGKDNFPELNERGLAHQRVFDEAIAPKYDCVPSTSPAIQYDPYSLMISQYPDRVVFRYEKDDQTRTVWLDDRKPTIQDYSNQGFSVGHYENGALIVHTDHFLFDITGFDDYNGIPSSQLKKVTERYWREGQELKFTVTVEDEMFLKKPASYTSRYLPQRPGYQLSAWDCDPETSRAPVRMMVPKYK